MMPVRINRFSCRLISARKKAISRCSRITVKNSDSTSRSMISGSRFSGRYCRMLRRWRSRLNSSAAPGSGPIPAHSSGVTPLQTTAPCGHTARQCWQFRQNRSSPEATHGTPAAPGFNTSTMQSRTQAPHRTHFSASTAIIN